MARPEDVAIGRRGTRVLAAAASAVVEPMVITVEEVIAPILPSITFTDVGAVPARVAAAEITTSLAPKPVVLVTVVAGAAMTRAEAVAAVVVNVVDGLTEPTRIRVAVVVLVGVRLAFTARVIAVVEPIAVTIPNVPLAVVSCNKTKSPTLKPVVEVTVVACVTVVVVKAVAVVMPVEREAVPILDTRDAVPAKSVNVRIVIEVEEPMACTQPRAVPTLSTTITASQTAKSAVEVTVRAAPAFRAVPAEAAVVAPVSIL